MEHYIEIPQEYVEPLLRSAAETGLSIEEVVDSAIKNYLERMIKNA
ncbi:CopG family transcriptional regulator [Ruminococcus sp. JL13D9]